MYQPKIGARSCLLIPVKHDITDYICDAQHQNYRTLNI